MLHSLALLLLPFLSAVRAQQAFSATGAYQSFVVPPGISSVEVALIGAGGGGGGGGGAFVAGVLPVTACETLRIIIGKGGDSCTPASTPGYNDTLLLCPTLDAAGGGGRGTYSGGGRSAIQRLVNGAWVELVTAGGGGGSGYGYSGGSGGCGAAGFGSAYQGSTLGGQNSADGSCAQGCPYVSATTASYSYDGRGGGGGGWCAGSPCPVAIAWDSARNRYTSDNNIGGGGGTSWTANLNDPMCAPASSGVRGYSSTRFPTSWASLNLGQGGGNDGGVIITAAATTAICSASPSPSPVTASLSSTPSVTPVTATPTPSFRPPERAQAFSATGTYQSFAVPPGVSSVEVALIGAGGGGGGRGGGGAFVAGILPVTACETLRIIIGKGGDSCTPASTPGYNDTLLLCPTLDAAGGGGRGTYSGGGRSAIQRLVNGSWVELVTAGGGGGSGYDFTGGSGGCEAAGFGTAYQGSTLGGQNSADGSCAQGCPFVSATTASYTYDGRGGGGGGWCAGSPCPVAIAWDSARDRYTSDNNMGGGGGTSWTANLNDPICAPANFGVRGYSSARFPTTWASLNLGQGGGNDGGVIITALDTSATCLPSPSRTPSPTPSPTPVSATPSRTALASISAPATATATQSAMPSATVASTFSASATATATRTATPSGTATATRTPVCPAGTWSPPRLAPGAPACHLCPPGTFSLAGSSSCSLCPAGTFGSRAGLASAACTGACASVADCPPGTAFYAPPAAAVACSPADARAVPASAGLQVWQAAAPGNNQQVDLVVAPLDVCQRMLGASSAVCGSAASSVVGADGVLRFVVGTAADLNMQAAETVECAAAT